MTLKIDSNGVQIQTLQEILDERQSNLLSVMGEDFTIDRTSPIGNMELADASNEQLIHEVVAYLASQLSSETAEGYFLDCICEYNNIFRFPQSKSKCDFRIVGEPNTVIIKGDLRIYDGDTGAYWLNNEDCTIEDNNSVLCTFECEEYGPFESKVGNTIEIKTPLNGLTRVETLEENNLIEGRYAETDQELRVRRRQAIQNTGAYSLDNIKSAIFTLEGIIDCKYIENYEEIEVDGVPAKSFEIIVDGGDEDDIIDIIFERKTLGVKPFGSLILPREDSQGNIYQIGYTKAIHRPVKIDITIKTNSSQTETWINNIKDNIITKFEEAQLIGIPVKNYTYYTVLTDIPEITDIENVEIFDLSLQSPSAVSTLPIATREIAKLDKANINIIFNN